MRRGKGETALRGTKQHFCATRLYLNATEIGGLHFCGTTMPFECHKKPREKVWQGAELSGDIFVALKWLKNGLGMALNCHLKAA
ncbi:MAG: hypothetical protein WC749_00655 [Dehalococcoidia bacterium]|uniref:hypothetical protein n=1 Tax=unclassified Pseudomonas TaxID=196821 RepID=UPI0014740704|nr:MULTISPECIES: hypothetical protein [unclassified Pseudomonas]NMX92541.1 hypothetical protein [Pseudomonas sp. WS 5086]NMY47180.1 hypothetical protein [Pseudomonas sp. WS 5027]